MKHITLTIILSTVLGLNNLNAQLQLWDFTNISFYILSEAKDSAGDSYALTEFPAQSVYKWNGLSWWNLPQLPSGFIAFNINFLNNNLVVIGSNQAQEVVFYSLNGGAWVAHQHPGLTGQAFRSIAFNGSLYISGVFDLNGAPENIIKWDLNNGYLFHSHNMGQRIDRIMRFDIFNSELYLSGTDSNSANIPIRKLSQITNQWEQVAHHMSFGTSFQSESLTAMPFKGKLYAVESQRWPAPGLKWAMHEVRNDSLIFLDSIPFQCRSYIVFDDKLFMAGPNFTTSITESGAVFDGQNLGVIQTPIWPLNLVEIKDDLYLVTDDYGTFKLVEKGVALIGGQTYLDDGNCVKTGADIDLPGVGVKLFNGRSTISGREGRFSFVVPDSTSYSIDEVFAASQLSKNVKPVCGLGGTNYAFSGWYQSIDIGFTNNVSTDMNVQINAMTGFRARHGSLGRYNISVSNAGNTTQGVSEVEVFTPYTVNFQSSSPAPNFSILNHHKYTVPALDPYETYTVILDVEIDPNKNQFGDQLNWFAFLSPIANDSDATDNSDTLIQTVVAAYDPNDKRANKDQIHPNTTEVDYHIRFQNTGNDTAIKVVVVDTLDVELPINKIIVNSASHQYLLRAEESVLIWEFDNIMLPDSSADYLGSQGYIRFTAGLKSNLKVGDTVKNDAHIYFDYQQPVHTNYAKSVVVDDFSIREIENEEVEIDAYPNPSSDWIKIKSNSTKNITVYMLDFSGKVIDEINLASEAEIDYSISRLPTGSYFLSFEDQEVKIFKQ